MISSVHWWSAPYIDDQRRTLMISGVHWWSAAYIDDQRCILMISGVHWWSAVYIDDQRRTLMISGVHWWSAAYIDDQRRTLMISGVHWWSTAYIDDQRRTLMISGAHWWSAAYIRWVLQRTVYRDRSDQTSKMISRAKVEKIVEVIKSHPSTTTSSPLSVQVLGENQLMNYPKRGLKDVLCLPVGSSDNTNNQLVYHSMLLKASPAIVSQVSCFIKSQSPSFTIHAMNCQKQLGSSDCGLFAIVVLFWTGYVSVQFVNKNPRMIHIFLCVSFRMKILSEGSQTIACILTIVDLITTPPTMYWLTKPMNLQTTSSYIFCAM